MQELFRETGLSLARGGGGAQRQEAVLLGDADWRHRRVPRWPRSAPGHPSCRGLRVSPHSWGWGGPLDAFPGHPLLRHKASFLPPVPQLPRGAWGAWLEVEGEG